MPIVVVTAFSNPSIPDGPWLWVTLGILVIAESCFVVRWFGITLTETDAVVNNLRRRRIPWSQVQAVSRDRLLGNHRVVLWTGGLPVPLRAPVTHLGLGPRRFEEDFHTIGQWWLAHRGPDWKPPAPPTPRPHRYVDLHGNEVPPP